MKLIRKLKRVIFTRNVWDTTGGVPGLLLMMADKNADQAGCLRLHGPSRLSKLVSSYSSFVIRHALPQIWRRQEVV